MDTQQTEDCPTLESQYPRTVAKVQMEFLDSERTRFWIIDQFDVITNPHTVIHHRSDGHLEYQCSSDNHESTGDGMDIHGGPELNWIENIVRSMFPDWPSVLTK